MMMNLTKIRLGTDDEVDDAVALAERFFAFNKEIELHALCQFSKDLFVAGALSHAATGGELVDILNDVSCLAMNPTWVMFAEPSSPAGRTWFAKFNRTIAAFPSPEAGSRIFKTCSDQWAVAFAEYEATCTTHKHPAFRKILQLARARKNILLVGPAGTGKTHAASQVAADLGLDFASISVTAGMSVSQLTGWIMPGGYLTSDFVRLYENGGVFLLDEMDAADANTLTVINQALANGGFHIAQRTENTVIKKHPDFVCIAAANTFGTGADMIYAGREQLDAATLDRFMNVYVDYDRAFEKKRCDPEILNFAHAVREAILKLKLRRVMSTRKAIDLSDMKRLAGWTLDECQECYFTGWSVDEVAKLKSYLG